MASTSVRKSPDLSPHSTLFKHIVTVEEVACFKPHPAIYHHLAETVGVGHVDYYDTSDVLLVDAVVCIATNNITLIF